MDVTVMLEPEIDLPRLTTLLDGLGHEGRVHTIRTWGKKEQAALFEAAKGYMPIDLDFLVPSSVGPLVEVIHDGHNMQPMFKHFQKRFAKLPDDPNTLVGYNEQAMIAFSGPGYFVATKGEGEHEGELVIDYTKVPTLPTLPKHKPEGWPRIVPNSGFGGVIYGGIDYLRALSSHVSIGRLFRNGPRGAWFALVRRDPG